MVGVEMLRRIAMRLNNASLLKPARTQIAEGPWNSNQY